jgi:hypothetical protein
MKTNKAIKDVIKATKDTQKLNRTALKSVMQLERGFFASLKTLERVSREYKQYSLTADERNIITRIKAGELSELFSSNFFGKRFKYRFNAKLVEMLEVPTTDKDGKTVFKRFYDVETAQKYVNKSGLKINTSQCDWIPVQHHHKFSAEELLSVVQKIVLITIPLITPLKDLLSAQIVGAVDRDLINKLVKTEIATIAKDVKPKNSRRTKSVTTVNA